jgi:hypothetical protein
VLNKTAQWWIPLPEGTKQRFDYWAVVARPPSNKTIYQYTPEEISLAEGWWTVEVRARGAAARVWVRWKAGSGVLRRQSGSRAARPCQSTKLPAARPSRYPAPHATPPPPPHVRPRPSKG